MPMYIYISIYIYCYKIKKTLKILDLEYSRIEHEGAKHLADMLSYKNNICELNLDGNEIGENGAKYLADSLRTNTVSYLD